MRSREDIQCLNPSDLKRTFKAMEGSLTPEMVASINKELKNVEMELAKK